MARSAAALVGWWDTDPDPAACRAAATVDLPSFSATAVQVAVEWPVGRADERVPAPRDDEHVTSATIETALPPSD